MKIEFKTLEEYARICHEEFVVYYPHVAIDYNELNLLSEAGEIIGVLAKCLRDESGILSDKYKDMLIKEIGDYIFSFSQLSLLGCIEEQNFPEFTNVGFSIKVFDGIVDQSKKLLSHTTNNCYYYCMRSLNNICGMLNITMQEICQINIDKLRDRKNRNTLSGSGDNR